jgi:uncharacterized membrane protein YphA (DoxX/SURF4 family)
VAEAQHFGLPLAPITAGATIVTELAASALVLTGIYRWFGALWLAIFTLIATFVANRFWEIPVPDRFMVENAFLVRPARTIFEVIGEKRGHSDSSD